MTFSWHKYASFVGANNPYTCLSDIISILEVLKKGDRMFELFSQRFLKACIVKYHIIQTYEQKTQKVKLITAT